ncbi:hypothetical protein HRI_003179500 [Hibiscus trionum]|uniref:DUF868 domain-containing protein n=1 Tax=Hibiscus trionum TaxID=183268 RepID=A0A9W7M9A6_HIBTR|nr:hypothetical protein HRI_003179500 [Hibiscus trionum]
MSRQRQHHSPSFPACFRPSTAVDDTLKASPSPSLPPPQAPGKTNLTTCFYHTNLGLFSLTWSRAFLGHSLLLNLYPSSAISFSALHFHLLIKPLLFWKRYGNRKLSTATIPNVHVFWDFSRAKFGSGPEPESGFFIAVVVDGEMILLVGDSTKEAYARTKAQIQKPGKTQALVSRREHLFSNKLYTTKARFGGKRREISIECSVNDDAELCFSVDNERVLRIKRLKWKFRGSELIEIDGVSIQVSWDVYNWLFDRDLNNGHAVFVFKFEDEGSEFVEQVVDTFKEENGVVLCRPKSPGVDRKRRSLLMAGISSTSSSASTSSASSGGSCSVMEWESVEESELSAPSGFSLLVYALKK